MADFDDNDDTYINFINYKHLNMGKNNKRHLNKSSIPDTSDKMVSKNELLKYIDKMDESYVKCGYGEKGFYAIKEYVKGL